MQHPNTEEPLSEEEINECNALAEMILEAIELSLKDSEGKETHPPEDTSPDLVEAWLKNRANDARGSIS